MKIKNLSGFFTQHEKRFERSELVPLLGLAYQYLQAWSQPEADLQVFFDLVALLPLEFLLIHSGVFMLFFPARVSLFLLIPFYGIFVYAFSMSMESTAMVTTYCIVMLQRLRFAFFDVKPALRTRQLLKSFAYAVTYLLAIGLAVGLENWIPRWGMSHEFLLWAGYFEANRGSGWFLEVPHGAMFFGALLYSLFALITYLFSRWKLS